MRDPSRARWPIIVSPVAWPDLTYHIPSNTARTESCYSLRPLSFPPHGRTVAFVLILPPHPPNAHIMKWEHSASNETSERDPFITQRINGLNKKSTSHCLHISQMCDSLSLIHEQNKKVFWDDFSTSAKYTKVTYVFDEYKTCKILMLCNESKSKGELFFANTRFV